MAHDRQQRTHDTRQSTRGWQRLTWLQHVEEALLEIIIVEDQAVSRRLDQLLEAAATLDRHSRQLCRGRGRQHFNQCVWQAVASVTSGCKLFSLLLGQLHIHILGWAKRVDVELSPVVVVKGEVQVVRELAHILALQECWQNARRLAGG